MVSGLCIWLQGQLCKWITFTRVEQLSLQIQFQTIQNNNRKEQKEGGFRGIRREIDRC